MTETIEEAQLRSSWTANKAGGKFYLVEALLITKETQDGLPCQLHLTANSAIKWTKRNLTARDRSQAGTRTTVATKTTSAMRNLLLMMSSLFYWTWSSMSTRKTKSRNLKTSSKELLNNWTTSMYSLLMSSWETWKQATFKCLRRTWVSLRPTI
jgi:hypothetical protein